MDGIIILDKPKGITSFQAARIVSRAFGREKTGHAGTLDPMATGVLPVMVGRATKLLQFLPETGKEYEAEALFGIRTDTADADGAVLENGGKIPSEEEFRKALLEMTGTYLQTPPMYSAVKKGGVPLYELARKGQTVERTPREVSIFDSELISFSGNRAVFRISCSAGTYVRTFAEDVAARCGTVCHLTALRRISACGFGIETAVTETELKSAAEAGRASKLLISPGELFRDLPEVTLSGDLQRLFLNGFDFPVSRTGREFLHGTRVRVDGSGDMIGLADVTDGGMLHKLWQNQTVN